MDGTPPLAAEARHRRAAVIIAGYDREARSARDALDHDDPVVRRLALGALVRAGDLADADLGRAVGDADPGVRRRAVELAVPSGVDLVPLLADPDPTVAMTAAWALGERPDATPAVVAALDLANALQGWLALRDLPYPPPFEHRLYAVVGDANILAGFTNILWPLALARLLTTRSALSRVLLGTLVVLALIVQAFCYSRGATLALAAGGLVFGALALRQFDGALHVLFAEHALGLVPVVPVAE